MSSSSGVKRFLVARALRQTRKAFLVVALVSALTNILTLVGPLYMMQIYDRVLLSRSVPTLVAISVLAAILFAFLGIFELIRTRILSQIGQKVEEDLGGTAFEAVLAAPLRTSKNDMAPQPLRDLDQLRQFMSGAGPVAICDLPWLPFYLILLFMFHSYLGWLAVVASVIFIAITLGSEAVLKTPMQKLSRLAGRRAEFSEAGRRNAEVLRAMGMQQAYRERWQKANDEYVEEQRVASSTTSSFTSISKTLRIALQSAVLALAAWLAIHQEVSAGAMLAASVLTARALQPIEQAIAQWRGFVGARQAVRRLRELIDGTASTEISLPLPRPNVSLALAGVTIAPPGGTSATVQDISFSLKAGQAVGLIGPSGSGKSTLARALVGIWPAIRGTIRLDGAEIDQWTPEQLGPSIGYLPQDIELFNGTVAENIARFSPDMSSEKVIEAAKFAGVHELILGLSDGYETRIGTDGAILSAGQRQRVGLARALYCMPFMIVLDEPNSNLDSDGEAALTSAIANARQLGSIVVVIAHRPSALAAVDHVLVMANGRSIAFGPRDEVLRKTTMRAVSEKSS